MMNFVSGTILSRVQKLTYFATSLCVGAVIWLVAIERASDADMTEVRAVSQRLDSFRDAGLKQEAVRAAVYRSMNSTGGAPQSFDPAAKAYDGARQSLQDALDTIAGETPSYWWGERYRARDMEPFLNAASAAIDQIHRNPSALG